MNKCILVLLLLAGAVSASAQAVIQQFASISKEANNIADIDLPKPTTKGSVLIAMPLLLTPDVKVVSVTDDAPTGGNTYKQVPGSPSTCKGQSVDIWYCENCHPGVTELKFHLSGHVSATIDAFMEVSGLALSPADGSGAQLSDGVATSDGLDVGPKITTAANDFIVGRYFATPPLPTGVSPAEWKYSTSFVYLLKGASGTYQPTLTGAKPGSNFCMSVAAFKAAPAPSTANSARMPQH